MYFDGVVQHDGVRVEIVLISPEKHILSYSFTLIQLCSNNMAKYQAPYGAFRGKIEWESKNLILW